MARLVHPHHNSLPPHRMISRIPILLVPILVILPLLTASIQPACAQHDHQHGHGEETHVERPRVFLDKNPRIVAYQLNRLDNQRLLLVERHTDHPKYAPVFRAILLRAGMSRQHRDEALQGLQKLNQSDAGTELIEALSTLDASDRQQQRTGRQLAQMLVSQSMQTLRGQREQLLTASSTENSILRSAALAALIVAGDQQTAWQQASVDSTSILDWLAAVSLVPEQTLRSALRPQIVELITEQQPITVRRAAVQALAAVAAGQPDTFRRVAALVANPQLRVAATRTLLKVPDDDRDSNISAQLVGILVEHAEATPAAERTTDEFIDAMQLADQLMAKIPSADARAYRARLREITVRVIRIHTVEEEMRYDTTYFAVEAGRPVQVVLQNEDLMPHNFVITANGALQEVAELGAALGPNPGFENKPYVPVSEKVLHATDMVQSGQQARLTFTAPSEPGEYPYVCTFPRHWMRMYGVMVVVENLDEWLRDPQPPKDPIGSNRAFVQSWKLDDFHEQLETSLRGRTESIGAKLFKEATCAQCHKVRGEGGNVGPELTGVLGRWKGDKLAVLREILDPSHRIDPKYAVQVIITDSGQVLTGIVKAEDDDTVSILVNPEAPEPTVVQRSEIDEMVKTSKSMMPKALLDRFSRDEVLEILSYVLNLEAPPASVK